MRKGLCLLLAVTCTSAAFGQKLTDEDVVFPVFPDSVVVDSLEIADAEEAMLYKDDTTDFVYFSLPDDLEYIPGDDDPALLRDRLSCIEANIPLAYNDKIHAFINYFTVRDREYTRLMIRRKNLYFPLFEHYLAKYGLPDELKYLAIIESGLNPRAVSRARAVGLWQFMSATGKYYGLDNNFYIDERMDPHLATDAACRYLRDLHRMFNDWELTLAAYNTGPGNVRRAIRRAGYKKSFWEIYRYLPRETRSYVPQFVAIIYTMKHLEEHNFFDEEQEMPLASDTVRVDKFLHFETFANLTGTCIEDLQKLNPSIRHNAVPETGRPYILHIPIVAKEHLQENRLAILDSASRVGKSELEAIVRAIQGDTYGRERVVYRVRSGDVLGSIAIRHGVTVAQLKKWNNLRSDIIRTGQGLNVWIKPNTTVASAQKTSAARSTVTASLQGAKTYTVQPGDTLWEISRKFDGLTIEKIKALNQLSNSKIHPGQTLVIAR